MEVEVGEEDSLCDPLTVIDELVVAVLEPDIVPEKLSEGESV